MHLLQPISDYINGLFRRPQPAVGKAATNLDKIQDIIGYRFRSEPLLQQALTHKSSMPSEEENSLASNERLEFLGDAVLNCLVTEHLYQTYPEKQEGYLSKIKSLIVSRKILGEIARTFDVGAYIIFGVSEEKTGGRDRLSILSNTFEALLGAIFLDGGYEPAGDFLRRFLFGRITEIVDDERNINYKSIILEKAQRDGFGMPRYVTLSASGPDHAKVFRVRVEVAGVALGEGCGSNKKIAQQFAAQNALMNYSKEAIIAHIQGESKHELVSH